MSTVIFTLITSKKFTRDLIICEANDCERDLDLLPSRTNCVFQKPMRSGCNRVVCIEDTFVLEMYAIHVWVDNAGMGPAHESICISAMGRDGMGTN